MRSAVLGEFVLVEHLLNAIESVSNSHHASINTVPGIYNMYLPSSGHRF